MSAHKQRQEMYQAYPSIVKRENDFEPDYYVRYLDGECKYSTPYLIIEFLFFAYADTNIPFLVSLRA